MDEQLNQQVDQQISVPAAEQPGFCLPEIPAGFSGWLVSGAIGLAWAWRLFSPKLRAAQPDLFVGPVDEFLDAIADGLTRRPEFVSVPKAVLAQELKRGPERIAELIESHDALQDIVPDAPVVEAALKIGDPVNLTIGDIQELKNLLKTRKRARGQKDAKVDAI